MNFKTLSILAAAITFATYVKATPRAELSASECVYPDAPTVTAPLWVCDVPIENFSLSAVGFSERLPTVSMTTAAATADARIKMSEHFATSVAQVFSDYQKSLKTEQASAFQINIELIRDTVTSATLFGTRVLRSITSPNQGRYVVIVMGQDTYKANAKALLAGLVDKDARIKRLFEDQKARNQLIKMIGNS